MSGKENMKPPKYTIVHPKRGAPRTRHHNPGTRYVPDEKRITMLSSVIVPSRIVAPSRPALTDSTNVRDPRIKPATSTAPSTITTKDLYIQSRPSTSLVMRNQCTQWETPIRLDAEPVIEHLKPLIPTPQADYEEGFRIYPGEAYTSSIPIYINRDVPWVLRTIDEPVRRRVYYDHEGSTDPRRSILKIELTRLPLTVYCPRELRVELQPLIRDLRVHLTQMRFAQESTPKTN